jgi:hypothetical protein
MGADEENLETAKTPKKRQRMIRIHESLLALCRVLAVHMS